MPPEPFLLTGLSLVRRHGVNLTWPRWIKLAVSSQWIFQKMIHSMFPTSKDLQKVKTYSGVRKPQGALGYMEQLTQLVKPVDIIQLFMMT